MRLLRPSSRQPHIRALTKKSVYLDKHNWSAEKRAHTKHHIFIETYQATCSVKKQKTKEVVGYSGRAFQIPNTTPYGDKNLRQTSCYGQIGNCPSEYTCPAPISMPKGGNIQRTSVAHDVRWHARIENGTNHTYKYLW